MRELPESPIISGTGMGGWNGRSMHHIDVGVVSSETDVVLVDGQDDNYCYRIGVYQHATDRSGATTHSDVR